MATNSGLGGPGFESGMQKRLVSSPKPPRPALGPTEHPMQSIGGTFPTVTRPAHEVRHSHPSSAEVKNKWSYTSTPLPYLDGTDTDNNAFFYLTF
jgi:hypothetical protein